MRYVLYADDYMVRMSVQLFKISISRCFNDFILGGAFMGQQDTEGINKSLESLCVSMTNHALEGW